MLEKNFSKRRMICAVAVLGGISVLIIILESRLVRERFKLWFITLVQISRALSAASVEGTADTVDVHESHPILKQNLTSGKARFMVLIRDAFSVVSFSGDKCWKDEDFAVVEPCDFCTESEIQKRDPIVCVAEGSKEEFIQLPKLMVTVFCVNRQKRKS